MADNTGYAPLGKVGIRPDGEWVIGKLYEKLDMVSYNGSSYLALIDNSVEPSDDGVNWMLAARGVSSDSLTNAETLGGKSPEHYATAQSVEELTNVVNDKAGSNHTHDDMYYTEAEIDTKLTEINNSINGKAASSHTHDERYYTEAEVNELLGGKSASGHTHDDRYYTETEIDAKVSTINTNFANYLPATGTAARALSDSNGAQINTTYRKKSEGSVVAIQSTTPTDTTALWAW